ncbi:MAG: SBBP repeat-containing protein [Bacteroidetes bacterium]|nr:SBBP repeat-containing protein [Bacteroidota bacterium]HET6243101.1 SBBP repeat-containing protein [Bacteroidia bacterium]
MKKLLSFIWIITLSTSLLAQAEVRGQRMSGFIENKGQLQDNSKTRFYTTIPGGKIFFLDNAISFVATNSEKIESKTFSENKLSPSYSIQRLDLLPLEFSGNTIELVPADIIYPVNFNLNGKTYHSAVYKTLIYKNVETGSELVLQIQTDNGLRIEYHNNSTINGISEFILMGSKDLIVNGNQVSSSTTAGDINFYFSNKIFNASSLKKTDPQTYNFSLSTNDRSSSVIWASFVGGSDSDELHGIDSFENNIVVTGFSASANFPITQGVIQQTKKANYDAVITKFSSSGTILWSTYYGGSSIDFAYKTKFDSQGNILVAGYSNSTDLYISANAWQNTIAGSYDSFILKLNPMGEFIWSTYFGGSGADAALTMDVDHFDNIVIAGFTTSVNLPLTANSAQNSLAGARDAFVAKFSSEGNLLYSTYFGGTASEDVHIVTFDKAGNILITGDTYSNDFPVTIGAFQTYNAGSADAYLTKFNTAGSVEWSTYFGGSSYEDPAGMTSDEDLNVYLSGVTQSNDFHIAGNSFQTTKQGTEAGFISKFNSNGNLVWSTYFDGNNNDRILEMKFHSGKYLFACGFSNSQTLPASSNATQINNGGGTDSFICVFDTAGNFYYSSYFGGNQDDKSMDIVINDNNEVFITGYTYSSDLPVSSNAFQTTYIMDGDAFIAGFNAMQWVNFNENPVNVVFYSKPGATDIKIYPNPCSDYINLNYSGLNPVTYEIIDNLGKVIVTGLTNSEITRINITFLLEGKYILRLKTKEQKIPFSASFIKYL